MIRLPAHPIAACCALLTLIALGHTPRPALAQAPAESPSAPARAEADPDTESGGRAWTCPMHLQVREAGQGKCPICSMELIAVAGGPTDRTAQLLSLQEMLAIALRHNPEVRAAQARVQAAEAELDRTRFDVLQQIVAFREKWEKHSATLRSALSELRQAERAAEIADPEKRQAADALAATARERYFLLRAKLGEIKAELPFLLGRAPDNADAAEPADAARKLIREELLPKARKIVQLRILEYSTGRGGVLEVAAAHRQLAELETRLATTLQQRIAAVESQQKLLQQTRDVAEALYKAGQASQGDVLAIEFEVSKLDLRLLELKGE